MQDKIKSLEEIRGSLSLLESSGKCIVHCHGVFDLLHPGHIHHFREAKAQGDTLVVSITPDRFVNKGPGRPAFNETLRLQALAALSDIDFVVLNNAPDAISAINQIRPKTYIKGAEYKDHSKDITGKIIEEINAVESFGGCVHYTSDDVVFSSSSLINHHIDPPSEEVLRFMGYMKGKYKADELLAVLASLKDLKVLVIGDAIIDTYQYVTPLGQSGKGLHMTAKLLEKELFLGGSLIIANHLAAFSDNVTLLTALAHNCPYRDFIDKTLDRKVQAAFLEHDHPMTLCKNRYVLQDGKQCTKLFETYSSTDPILSQSASEEIIAYIKEEASGYDLVLVCDFANGFTNEMIIEALSNVETFLAVNTQTNSGNRGYIVITHYKRADFISLNEGELRLAAHDKLSPLPVVLKRIATKLSCPSISITKGTDGVLCHDHLGDLSIPAFTTSVVDRVGAGDSYFALAAMCLAIGQPFDVAGFIGSLASSMNVQVVGNKESASMPALGKYLVRLMK